jgi:hypothetical protein
MEKPFLQHAGMIGLMLLIGSASFGLGRLTLLETKKTPVTIDYFASSSSFSVTAVAASSSQSSGGSQEAFAALAPIPGVKGIRAPQMLPEIKPISMSTSTVSKPLRVVASKKGKRYYYESCAGVKNLSAANKVYYKSAAAAESMGLVIARGCTVPQ